MLETKENKEMKVEEFFAIITDILRGRTYCDIYKRGGCEVKNTFCWRTNVSVED